MRYIVSAGLVVAAIIHIIPLMGVLGNDRLNTMYAITVTDPNFSILMRHRAVLFGILGFFLLFAAFIPAYQTAALIAGWISVVAFFALAWSIGNYNPSIQRIVNGDIIALVGLVAATGAHVYIRVRG